MYQIVRDRYFHPIHTEFDISDKISMKFDIPGPKDVSDISGIRYIAFISTSIIKQYYSQMLKGSQTTVYHVTQDYVT